LLTPEDEEEMINEELPDSPHFTVAEHGTISGVVIPITAGRDKSIKLINDANAAGKIMRCGSKDESDEDPTKTISIHHRSQNFARFKMPDGILP
jgi:ATP-dependent Lon protease